MKRQLLSRNRTERETTKGHKHALIISHSHTANGHSMLLAAKPPKAAPHGEMTCLGIERAVSLVAIPSPCRTALACPILALPPPHRSPGFDGRQRERCRACTNAMGDLLHSRQNPPLTSFPWRGHDQSGASFESLRADGGAFGWGVGPQHNRLIQRSESIRHHSNLGTLPQHRSLGRGGATSDQEPSQRVSQLSGSAQSRRVARQRPSATASRAGQSGTRNSAIRATAKVAPPRAARALQMTPRYHHRTPRQRREQQHSPPLQPTECIPERPLVGRHARCRLHCSRAREPAPDASDSNAARRKRGEAITSPVEAPVTSRSASARRASLGGAMRFQRFDPRDQIIGTRSDR